MTHWQAGDCFKIGKKISNIRCIHLDPPPYKSNYSYTQFHVLIQVCLPQSLFLEIIKGIPWEKYQFTVNAPSHASEDLILHEFHNLEREAIELD